MITQVLKERPVLIQSGFEPDKIDWVDVLVGD